MLRVLIVDDESPARSILREYLAQHADVEIAGECTNGFEAVKAVGELEPDLMFLDVQMPKLDGFEVLELLETPPAVVFVTAYDEFAIRAFDVHAVDYLLKPFRPERLAEALDRARGTAAAPREPGPAPSDLSDAARPEGAHLDRILVRDGAKIHVIPADTIEYIEAQDDAVCIRAAGVEHRKSETLGRFEKSLDPGHFVRIHRSYILNLDCLDKVELYAKDSRLAILKDGRKLPVSRSGYARLRELL